jgi:hypothetical protein
MDKEIAKVVDQIIKELDASNFTRADRLQLVLNELVKVQIAEIEASKL